MYYKRELPVASAVYRHLETRRYLMMSLGGYWPVIHKLPDGRLGVLTRDSDIHIGERGRIVFVTSADGGESWSHATVVSAEGPDNRDPGFGVAADGTLLVSFRKADYYTDGHSYNEEAKAPGGRTPIWITRSEDVGATWSEAELVDVQGNEQWSGAGVIGPDAPHRHYSTFGKILTLADGTILMPYIIFTYISSSEGQLIRDSQGQPAPGRSPRKCATMLVRSHDGGRTWVDPVNIGEGYVEPALCDLGDGRLLVILRQSMARNRRWVLWQSDSSDNGYNWSKPRPVTGDMEFPGDVIRLKDGRLLLTYGRRVPPYGIQGMVSQDDGRTWDGENRLLLVGDSGTYDCGYPSSVQLEDGTIVTVYYAWDSVADNFERQHHRLGVHGAALLYQAQDLP